MARSRKSSKRGKGAAPVARRTAKDVVAITATFDPKQAERLVEQYRKAHKGALVTRRRETFGFGVAYVVLAVR